MKELVQIQAELKAPKNQRNNFGGYNYRSAEDILEAVKPLLKQCGCVLVLSDDIVEFSHKGSEVITTIDKKDGTTETKTVVSSRVYVKATATLINKDGATISTSAYAREEENKKGQDAAQTTGAASSYARKYALNGLFCIDDTKDADATNTHDKDAEAAQPAKIDIKKAEAEIIACKDGKTLSAVWGRYKDLPNNAEVEKIVKAQMEKLGITSNGNKAK